MMLSTRSSTVHAPPFESTCHCSPTIWLGVAIVELAGLFNEENGVVKVVAAAVTAARVNAGYCSQVVVDELHVPPVGFVEVAGR